MEQARQEELLRLEMMTKQTVDQSAYREIKHELDDQTHEYQRMVAEFEIEQEKWR